ncbi:hypothetical protein BU26DRAFT_45597 [Trematosphaeria pertusa]|uniref:Ig-like domain-containing protein n=1 Tax=Trematosphaeria pertusa TaxID=390896 RepID=A0A6A6I8A0_9PLEO|nr:uncharacterized protein BU26DRAFT_45597 [Trematosphaeria pertusa]KAF2246439.1 hypothetical protein BU26DRAFT_45597 [Trematosphaeria pertusa]
MYKRWPCVLVWFWSCRDKLTASAWYIQYMLDADVEMFSCPAVSFQQPFSTLTLCSLSDLFPQTAITHYITVQCSAVQHSAVLILPVIPPSGKSVCLIPRSPPAHPLPDPHAWRAHKRGSEISGICAVAVEDREVGVEVGRKIECYASSQSWYTDRMICLCD